MILKSGFLVSWLIVHESVNNYLALAAIHPAIASQTPLLSGLVSHRDSGCWIGWNQEEIASVFGVARNTVSDWLGDKNMRIVGADNVHIPDSRVKIPKEEYCQIFERVAVNRQYRRW